MVGLSASTVNTHFVCFLCLKSAMRQGKKLTWMMENLCPGPTSQDYFWTAYSTCHDSWHSRIVFKRRRKVNKSLISIDGEGVGS